MAANSFTEFCQMKRLSTETITILLENGFSDKSDLELLTDADIDSNFKGPLLLVQRLRLKAVVKELQSGGNSAQCEAGPRSGLIKRTYFEPQPTKSDIRIVLLGKTGAGKSTTANTIYGREEFHSMAGFRSQTAMCSGKVVGLNNLDILVLDTPGVCDFDRPADEVAVEITRCLALSLPGPHCLIMIIKYGRLTEEEFFAYLKIKAIFGENVKRHMILLFTGGDEMQTDIVNDFKMADTSGLNEVDRNLLTLVQDVNNRYTVFNNKADPEVKDRQVLGLMKMVTDLLATHSHFHDEAVNTVARELKEQACTLAHAEQIPFEQAEEIIRKEINAEKKSERLMAITNAAKALLLVSATAGLVAATGGLGAVAVAGVAGEVGASAVVAAAAGATAFFAGALGVAKASFPNLKGRENSICSLM